MRAEAYIMKDHDCPNKPIHCPYCEAAIIGTEYERHEAQCATRTEQCPRCRKYVQKRGKSHVDQREHDLACAQPPRAVQVRTEPMDVSAYNRDMLRAQLRSEGIDEADIASMLGESPSTGEPVDSHRPLPPTLLQHSDSGESTPIDSIPSIDFASLRPESFAPQVPSSDMELSEEEQQLNEAIMKSLSDH